MDKVLIIDDDEELCELVSEYLTVEGFETECVNDGETGLKRALAAEHDLAILDVMLPKMNGFDVLRALRERRNCRDHANGPRRRYGTHRGARDRGRRLFA
jgi:two-component system response regulator CpxR